VNRFTAGAEKYGAVGWMALQLGKMKSMALGMCLAWLVLIPVCALGDGGFIPSTAFQKVEIPDQRA